MANNGKLPWLVVYLLFIAMVIAYIHRVDLSSALPLMSDEFGWSATQLGQASSAFFWIYFMLQIPAGYATDRWGVHFVFWAGFVIWCGATLLTALTTGFAMLLGLRLLLGIGQSIVTPAGLRYIRLSFPEEQRGTAVGVYMSGTKVGPAVGFVVCAYLLNAFGWRGMFAALGIGSLLWLIPFFIWVKREDPAARPSTAQPADAGRAVPTSELMRSPVIWGTAIGTFCYMYFVYYCMTWMPTYFKQQHGMSIKEQGWYSAVAFGGMAIVIVAAGRAADLLIRRGYDAVNVRKGFTIAGFSLRVYADHCGLHGFGIGDAVLRRLLTVRAWSHDGELLGLDANADSRWAHRNRGGFSKHRRELCGRRFAMDYRMAC